MKTRIVFVFAMLLSVAAWSARAEDDNAKKIIGTWEITKSEEVPAGSVVEFTKDGKLIINTKLDDKDLKLEGTYKVEKDKLMIKITFMGETNESTDEIVKLTDDAMELKDKDKKVTTLKKKK